MIRVGETFLGKSYYQGFHPTGTCGVFGAAAACAALLELNAKQTTYALGLAGSFTSGTQEWSTEGSWQKPLQAGHPAMFGVLCALLAQKNFIGARTVFEGPNGFIRAHSFKDIFDYGRITKQLGKKWEMVDTSIKVHACCRFSGPVADCALDLYRQGVRSKNVKSIVAKSATSPSARCALRRNRSTGRSRTSTRSSAFHGQSRLRSARTAPPGGVYGKRAARSRNPSSLPAKLHGKWIRKRKPCIRRGIRLRWSLR